MPAIDNVTVSPPRGLKAVAYAAHADYIKELGTITLIANGLVIDQPLNYETDYLVSSKQLAQDVICKYGGPTPGGDVVLLVA